MRELGPFSWRYRWDLNPRCAFTHTTFRELHLRPLGHGTEDDLRRLARKGQNERMPRPPFSDRSAASHTVGGVVQSSRWVRRAARDRRRGRARARWQRVGWRRFRARLTANSLVLNETLPVHSKWWRDHAKERGRAALRRDRRQRGPGHRRQQPRSQLRRRARRRDPRGDRPHRAGGEPQRLGRDRRARRAGPAPPVREARARHRDRRHRRQRHRPLGSGGVRARHPHDLRSPSPARARGEPAVLLLPAQRAQGRRGQPHRASRRRGARPDGGAAAHDHPAPGHPAAS